MSVRGLRFIHSSDWHLERPLSGLADVPDHLRETLLDAAYRGATRVCDLAISENVDFLLLAGDILHPALAGPRAVLYLTEQFQRLASHDIRVYWALGPTEASDDWLLHAHFPSNVHVFFHSQPEQVDHVRDGRTIARIVGRGYAPHHEFHPAEFNPEPGSLPTIAVAYAGADDLSPFVPGALSPSHSPASAPTLSDVVTPRKIDYWALGGQHSCDLTGTALHPVAASETAASPFHFSGTHQGREHDELGSHGCLLASMNDSGQIRTQFISTDEVRWHDERVDATTHRNSDKIESLLCKRLEALRSESRGVILLVRWTICGNAKLAQRARRGELTQRITERLRAQYGHATPTVWTTGVDVESVLPAADVAQQDTLLGDFMRLVHRCEQGEEPPLDLDPWISERHRLGGLHDLLAVDDPLQRKRILHEAALQGAEWLTGHVPGQEAEV